MYGVNIINDMYQVKWKCSGIICVSNVKKTNVANEKSDYIVQKYDMHNNIYYSKNIFLLFQKDKLAYINFKVIII